MWSSPNTTFNLIVYCICKFFFIILSITCPIPNGIFAPIYSLGGGFGRLYGNLIRLIGEKIGVQLIRCNNTLNFLTFIDEGIYAVVGAASIGGSATKTISTIVITFEMLGQVGPLLIPVSIGLLTAYWCTTGVAMGIFDVIIEFKNFPYMPSLGSLQAYSLKASDIMNRNFMYLSRKSTLSDIPAILSRIGEASVTIPVVESAEHKVLLYTITSASLKTYLYDHYRQVMVMFD
jgi:chloride channel 2